MLILLTGATGFLGHHLLAALTAAGHSVRAVRRSAPSSDPVAPGHSPKVRWVQADFSRDQTPESWSSHVQGVDAVINAAGILRETRGQSFDAVHERGPIALFHAAARAGVAHILQISALGADEAATTRYHLSKKHADDVLRSLPVTATILQPSLVFGPGGASATMLLQWAALPLIPLPGDGQQRIQPVYIDDLADAVVALLAVPRPPPRVAAVGPRALPLRDYLAVLRRSMGVGRAHFLPIPMPLTKAGVALAARLPGSLADPDSLAMLERGNTADPGPFSTLLDRPLRAPGDFIAPDAAGSMRAQARLGHLLPVLRLSIALVWIVSGVVSLWVFPLAESLDLLHRSGVPAALAPLMLYSAAGLDFVLGVATLTFRRRRRLWLAQIALIVFYTAVISWTLPEFWAHPYGPIVKNLPLLAAIWLLHELEA